MTDTNPPADRKLRFTLEEVRAKYAEGTAEVPLDATTEQRAARCNAGLKLLGYSRDFVDTLMARVEELERQAATVRSEAAIDALMTARQAVSDHRKGLSRNRSRVDARFQGRLQGIEEATGRLTALIKSLRANNPAPSPTRAPDSVMDPFEAADDIDRRWGS